ncbi:hypothetical protein [Paracoccus sp. PAR01]|uniref:hypothetical protein n=1 Tax=Paracoccus sp. PAR01 TaxID=2769282 RepID=UPI00351C4247
MPEDCQDLHRDPVSRKRQTQLFSLKTIDQTEASKRANSHTLRLDATWKAYR